MKFATRFGFLDKGEDLNNLMQGIESFLSYNSRVGIYPEFHWPIMKFLEFYNGGKPGGPFLPVIQVCPT